MRHISHAAMARILQSAIAECTIVTPIKCIIRYAETLSTDDIPAIILDREDFQRYKAMIDLAAERSARARMAARRRAAMRKVEDPKRSEEAVAQKPVDNSSAPSTPSDAPTSTDHSVSSDSSSGNTVNSGCPTTNSQKKPSRHLPRPADKLRINSVPIKVTVSQARGYKPGFANTRYRSRNNTHR